MNVWQAIVLGLVQGLAEFLPISSSGHLILVRELMGISGTYLLFDIMLHVATLFAIFLVFFRELLALFKPPFRTIGLLIIATIPAVISGLVLSEFFDEVFSSAKYLCFFFLISAALMLATELLSKRLTQKSDEFIGLKAAIIMGSMQAVAVLPGITRSGSTIFGGTVAKQQRSSVAKFSFFMSIPIILGSAVLELTDVANSVHIDWFLYLVGMLAAFASGLLAIKLMLKVIAKANFKWFALYLFTLSVVTFFVYFL